MIKIGSQLIYGVLVLLFFPEKLLFSVAQIVVVGTEHDDIDGAETDHDEDREFNEKIKSSAAVHKL